MTDEKKAAEKKIRDDLFLNRKNGYDRLEAGEAVALQEYAEGYKAFLDRGKTEREAVDAAEVMARAAGYEKFTPGMRLAPGAKVYAINRGKAIACVKVGRESLERGARIVAAHVDAPRIDLKPCPLYEDASMAFFKTHYYGGIRKYQWVTVPLELRGVIAKPDGSVINVSLGGVEGEPVFVITDLLPHLAKDHNAKTLGGAFTGEDLNVLAGSQPYADEGENRFKLSALSILNEKYGLTEEDFLSSELCFVPVGKSRDVGLDQSLIGAYGQDDRVCAYTALTALLEQAEDSDRTCVCVLVDKEEIGSEGISGMQSEWFDTFMSDICDCMQSDLRRLYENSYCLSADVSNAFDPNFPEVSEKNNSAVINGGAVITKYTGSGGKSSSNDASAEYIAMLRKLFADNKVIWQTGELGKVDQGGGGTVAKYMANRNIETIDVGAPVLAMHSPFEITSKLDVYMLYKAMKAFYRG